MKGGYASFLVLFCLHRFRGSGLYPRYIIYLPEKSRHKRYKIVNGFS